MEYSKIIKEKIGIEFEGLHRGEKFLEFFSQELNNLKLKNNTYLESKKLLVFDKKKKVSIDVIIPEDFQNELQNLYKKFVREFFLTKYEWYNKFLTSIFNTLEFEFKLDKKNKNYFEIIDFFNNSLTTSFLVNFNMKNTYDLKKISSSMVEMFNATGFDLDQSTEMKDKFLDGFIKDHLIKIEKKNFFNQNKTFSLSDPCISVVFGVTSMFLPNVFAINEHNIKFNSNYQLMNLEYCLKNFKNFVSNYDAYNIYRSFFFEKNLDLLNKLDDYNDISSVDLNGFSHEDKQAIIIIFFMKLVVNEFCFQTLVMSCFESYYYTSNIKNILFSKEIIELHLYKNINDF